jgi:hypothetical protein
MFVRKTFLTLARALAIRSPTGRVLRRSHLRRLAAELRKKY